MTQTTSSGVSNLSRAECEERATMTIAAVLAFREGLGTSVIPPTVIHAAELIHGHTTKQVETQGWNRVDWRSHRGGGGGGGGGGRGGSGPARGGGGWKAPASSNGSAPASGPPAKYVSQFKQTEKTKDAVLFIILDKLNKFAPKNYSDIYEFLCQILDDGQTAFLKDFMKVVFEKATQEEMFCAHYVRLLCELSVKYSILSKEMIERYKEYSALFGSLPTTLVAAPSDDEEDTLSEKKYFLGYSQFLAELVKYNVLNPDLFTETLQNIIGNIPVAARLPAGEGKRALETYVDCMLRILREIKTQQTPLAASLRAILKERFVTVLEPLTVKDAPDYTSLGPKSRFGITDIVKLIKSM